VRPRREIQSPSEGDLSNAHALATFSPPKFTTDLDAASPQYDRDLRTTAKARRLFDADEVSVSHTKLPVNGDSLRIPTRSMPTGILLLSNTSTRHFRCNKLMDYYARPQTSRSRLIHFTTADLLVRSPRPMPRGLSTADIKPREHIECLQTKTLGTSSKSSTLAASRIPSGRVR